MKHRVLYLTLEFNLNDEYHSFYLDTKLRTLDTPLSCQPGIRLTSDREKNTL